MIRNPTSGLITLTYIIYGLHLFSAATGLMTPAFVVTAFLSGWPSIIAVILNYAKRSDVVDTYLESHFRWQIRTFWFTLLWLVVAGILFLTVIAIPVSLTMLVVTGIWVLYRIIRGLLRLLSEQPMPMGR